MIIIKKGRRLEDNDKSKMSYNRVAPPSLRSKRFQSSQLRESWSGSKRNGRSKGRGKGKAEFTTLPSPFIPLICTCPNFLDKLAWKRLLVPRLIASQRCSCHRNEFTSFYSRKRVLKRAWTHQNETHFIQPIQVSLS